MFNVNRFILAALENCGPYVDRIYLTRSEIPWRYNIEYRDKTRNPTPASILDSSPWRNKVTLIESEWATEEEQRNESLLRARADGMDFMIIQDADEFYHASEYQRAFDYISAHPDYDFYKVKSYVFWKSTKYIIKNRYGQPYDEDLKPFAINCRSGVEFLHLRGIDETKWRICPELLPAECHHLSWVMSDEELFTKLSVWGHTNDFDWRTWYADKWLNWYPGKYLFGRGNPAKYSMSVEFTGELPEALRNFRNPAITIHSPGRLEWLANRLAGECSLAMYRTLFGLRTIGKKIQRLLGLKPTRRKKHAQQLR